MKIPYFKRLGASLALALLGLSASAQTGIGTTTPRSMLDVNGAISVAETTAAVTGNAATIPTGFSLVRLTGGASAAVTLTAAASPVPVAGQLLTIFNNTTFPATFSGQTIAAGQTLSLVYSNGSWQGTAGGIGTTGTTGTTASNGLTKTGNDIALGGTLTGATDVATAGNNLTFSGTGKVGIGTTTPVQALDVMGTGLFRNGGSSTSTIGNEQLLFGYAGTATYQHVLKTRHSSSTLAGNAFDFYTWNASTDLSTTIGTRRVMTLDGNGNVGIGTGDPNALLELAGASASATATNTVTQMRLSRATVPSVKYANVFDVALGSYATGVNSQSQVDFNLANGTVNTPDMTVLSLRGNGNVGIGTTTPNAPLQLANTTANRKIVLYDGANNDHQFFGLGVNNSTLRYQVDGTGSNHVFYAGTGATTSNELMRITGTGNVGIGTTTPSSLLDVNGTTRLRGLTTAGVVTTDASGNLSSVTTASLNPTTASNGLTKTGNDIALGGTLTQATTVTQGNNNLTFSTGTTGTGVLVLDGQGIAGSTTNTAKQRIEFTSSGDPNAAIGHTVATGTTEVSDLYMYSGNDNQTGVGPDRIRLVGENILFQSFNNGSSNLANAEANSGTTTNMFIGASGSVGIGTTTPSSLLDVNGTTRLRGLTTAGLVTTDANGNLSSATAASLDATTASNGLTKTGNNIALGGALTGATDVATAGNNLTFSGTGKVGIGTTTPVQSLDVTGTGLFRNGGVSTATTGNEQLVFGFGGGANFQHAIKTRHNGGAPDGNALDFYTWNPGTDAVTTIGTNRVMTLDGSGKVGIGLGTTTPTQSIDAIGTARLRGLTTAGVVTTDASGNLSTSTAASLDATTASNGLTKTGNNIALGGALTGATDVATAGNNLTFSGTGNVGIGTTTPNAPLQLANTTANRKIVLYDGANNDHQYYGLGVNNSTLRYQVDGTASNHVFYAGTGATTSTELMRITGTGNVGIGTSSPNGTLHVVGTASNTLHLQGATHVVNGVNSTLVLNTYGASIGSNTATKITGQDDNVGGGILNLVTNNTNRVTILNNGKVGIGTTTPVQSLDVAGTGLFRNGGSSSATTGNEQLVFGYGGVANFQHAIKTRHNSSALAGNALDFYTWNYGTDAVTTIGTNRVMTLDGNGNVGIGTATPSALLDVNGSTRLRSLTTAGLVTTDASGNLSSASAASLNPTTASNGLTKTGNDIALGGALTGATTISGITSANLLTLTGTAAPRVINTSAASASGTQSLVLSAIDDGTVAGTGNYLSFTNGTFSEYGRVRVATESNANLGMGFSTYNGSLSEKMRISAAGNVGIGTTTPNAQLQLANTTANRKIVLYDGANNDHQFFGLGVNNSTLRYQVDGTGSNHVFYAGTGATTSTELMRINGNGNVGIGTSSPNGTLHVVGTASNTLHLQGATHVVNGVNSTLVLNSFGASIGSNPITKITGQDDGSGGGILNLVTNNTNRVTILNNGKVGIGTTTPVQSLDVAGTGLFRNGGSSSATTGNEQLVFGYGGVANFQHAIKTRHNSAGLAGNALDFYTWNYATDAVTTIGTNRVMTLDGNGNVGIGIAAPSALLDVNGSTRLRSLTTAGLVTTDASGNLSSASAASLNPTTASNGLTKTGNDIALGGTLTGATTVDLGTNNLTFTSTAGRLVLQGNTNGSISNYVWNSNPGSSANSIFQLGNDGSSSMYLFLNSSTRTADGGINVGTLRNDAGDLRLQSKGSVGMTIASTTGNVGIGTSATNAQLQLASTTASRKIVLYEGANNDNQFFGFGINNSTLRYQVNSTSDNHVFYAGTGATTSTELMRINGNGNVGIGTSAPNGTLHVVGTASNTLHLQGATHTNSGVNSTLVLNTYGASLGSNANTKITGQDDNVGGGILNLVTNNTNRVTILNNGNVGIGTSTPATRLQVVSADNLFVTNVIDVQAANLSVGVGIGYGGIRATGSLANNDLYLDGKGTGNLVLQKNATGGVGIGTATPAARLQVVSADNLFATNVIDVQAANLSVGVGISYGGIRATGSNVNNDLYLDGKGAGHLVLQNFATGNVGIGTSSPAFKTDIVANTANGYVMSVTNNSTASSAGAITINLKSASNFPMRFQQNGVDVGAITTTASTTSYGTTSDIRLKKNIVPTHYGLSDVMKVNVRDYVYKADATATPQTGFIAQQLYSIYPIAVTKGDDNDISKPYMVDYSKLTPLLTKAIQEQQAEIEALKAANTGLKAELKAANTGLKAELKAELADKASASTINELQAALQSLRAEVQTLKAGTTTASK